MAWTTKAGDRPAPAKPGKNAEQPYPEPLTRHGIPKPADKPKPAGKP